MNVVLFCFGLIVVLVSLVVCRIVGFDYVLLEGLIFKCLEVNVVFIDM